MYDNLEKNRKSQRMSAILAVLIVLILVSLFPLGGALPDYMNESNAPANIADKYAETVAQSGVDFNMDSTAFLNKTGFNTYYVWKNATGYTNYNPVTHTAGVASVRYWSTAGNWIYNSTSATEQNISWAQMHPYFEIYFAYTAKQAYDDNAVLIRLYVSSIYVSGNAQARTITLSAGDQTFYTITKAATDTDTYIDKNVTLDVNDLRRAIISAGTDNCYFKLKITAQDYTLSIAGTGIYAYNAPKLFKRDDGLMIFGLIAVACVFLGVFLVQPKYSLPIGKKTPDKGRW